MRIWQVILMVNFIHGCFWDCCKRHQFSDDPKTKDIVKELKFDKGTVFYFIPKSIDYCTQQLSWRQVFVTRRLGRSISRDVGILNADGSFYPPLKPFERSIVLFNQDSTVPPQLVKYSVHDKITKLRKLQHGDADYAAETQNYNPEKPKNKADWLYEFDNDAKKKLSGKNFVRLIKISKTDQRMDSLISYLDYKAGNLNCKVRFPAGYCISNGFGVRGYYASLDPGEGPEDDQFFSASTPISVDPQNYYYAMQDDDGKTQSIRFLLIEYNDAAMTMSIKQSRLFTKDDIPELKSTDFDLSKIDMN